MRGVLSLLLALAVFGPTLHAAEKPNVVFILADDLGWVDTSTYGSRYYPTPNIARLAERGIRFTNAYTANPLCSPTRASILTGLYPGRLGITTPSCHLPTVVLEAKVAETGNPQQKAVTPNSVTRLKTEYPTLSKSLKASGYATAHFGKWHLGAEPYSPLQNGFDSDLPHTPGPGPGGGYLAPWRFWPDQGKPGEHIEDRMATEAMKFIEKNRDRPFYLNYWAFSVHGPWNAKPELVDQYRKSADPKSPQRNPVYAAMIHSLDDAIGKLLDTLDRLKLTDRTLIVFTSDNGGVHWLDDRMRAAGLESPPTSNAPLRGGKATLYEGGTRVPSIIVWPGRVKPGTVSDAFVSTVDWYPTLLEATGVAPASGQQFDGVSQMSAVLGKPGPRDTLFCFFPHYTPATGNLPGVWVRRGDWKLIRFFHDGDDQKHRHELYNLKDDLGETKNLAETMPEKVRELDALIDGHLRDIHAVLPRPNPNYRKEAATAARPVQGWREQGHRAETDR